MKLLNLKSAIAGLMVVAVMSLNFVNPFSSQNNDDVKGIAYEMPVSATQGSVSSAAWPVAVWTVARWVVVPAALATPAITTTLAGGELSVDGELLDKRSKVEPSNISLSKLD